MTIQDPESILKLRRNFRAVKIGTSDADFEAADIELVSGISQ